MKKFNFFLTALLVFMAGWVSPGWAQSTEYLTGLTNDDKDTDKQMVSFTLPGTYIAGGASKKYVMIDGKKDTEIGGKIRINRKTTNLDKGIEIKVNEGYKITAVEVAFYSNNDAPSSVVGVYADGTSTNLLSAAVECPQNKSKDDVKTFSVSGFEATQLVEFEFGTHDDGATQAIWAMKVTYDEAGGDEPVADEPLMTLNGKVLAEPNAIVSEMLSLEKMKEEGINVISMSDPADNVKVDVYEDYFIIKNFMNAEGVDLKCWYQVDDSDEENPQTMVYKYEIVGQEIAEENIPGNVQGSYIEVNKEGYDLQMGMCNLSPVGGWLTIIASKLSDMENFYHYTLDFSEAVEVEKPTVTPAEGEYDELQSFTINFGQAVTIPVEDWDNGVYYVPTPFIVGKNTWAYESAALVPGENEGEVIFSLDKPIVKADTYTLTLPEGCVIFADGTKNPEFTYTYTVTGNNFKVTTEEGEISMTITPAEGETVSTLSKFELVLEGFLNIPTWEVEVALYDEAGEEVTQGSFEDNFDGTYSIELWSKVTKAGTYTLKFTIPNQNEAFDVIGTHDYELTYIVDGSDYVEMPYTLAAVTAELPADENYDNMESAVKLGLAQEVVVDEDHFVVKNLFGIEGYDLTAYYQMWGEWCYVMGIQVPGVEEPSQMVEVTPNEEIGTVGLMVSDVTLDPKDGSIYLQVVRQDGEDWNYSYYYIVWNEETATGINNATAAPVALDGAYNLAGQKVSSNFKGIVIKNGKKIAVK